MKHCLLLLLSFFLVLPATAQRSATRQDVQRVQAAKIGYLTKRMNLSDEQAQRFWPVYHRYEEELRAARRKAFARLHDKRNPPVQSEADALRTIESRLDAQEDRLEVQRKYKSEFLRVLSAEQLLALYDAEREFNRLVLQRVRQQRQKRVAR
jgi:hypothetical protein